MVSLRLGEPATLEPITSRLDDYPTLRFKLDATSSWTPELIAALVETGAVDSIDFKALYHGTIVDQPPDPVLYRRVVDAFPDAWIEDPDVVTEATAAALAAVHDRITWDAPIHSIADIESLPFPPRMVNIKPSRIGGLKKLCDTYDYCAEHGIGAYGGGQFELGPGRGQAQYLASLFHPDTPNDLAPAGFNESEPRPGLPSSPLAPAATDRLSLAGRVASSARSVARVERQRAHNQGMTSNQHSTERWRWSPAPPAGSARPPRLSWPATAPPWRSPPGGRTASTRSPSGSPRRRTGAGDRGRRHLAGAGAGARGADGRPSSAGWTRSSTTPV